MSLREKIADIVVNHTGHAMNGLEYSETDAADAILSAIAESVPRKAVASLLNYQQADQEGIMVLAPRQAIHEVCEVLKGLCDALEATGIET